MQDRSINPIQEIKIIRDKLNNYLGQQPSYFSEKHMAYIYPDFYRHNLLQTIVGGFHESRRRQLSLWDLVANRQPLTSNNIALLITRLNAILQPINNAPNINPKSDLIDTVHSTIIALEKLRVYLKNNEGDLDVQYEDNVMMGSRKIAKTIKDLLNIYLVNQLHQLKKIDKTEINPKVFELFDVLQSIVGKPGVENKEISLYEMIYDENMELINSDNFSSLIDRLYAISKMTNSIELDKLIDYSITQLTRARDALTSLEALLNDEDEEIDSEDEGEKELEVEADDKEENEVILGLQSLHISSGLALFDNAPAQARQNEENLSKKSNLRF